MPFPFVNDPDAKRISTELRRIADLVDRIHREPEGVTFRELLQIANRFARIADTLEKGVAKGNVTAAQLRSIGANFDGVGDALRKGAARRPTAARRTTRTRSR